MSRIGLARALVVLAVAGGSFAAGAASVTYVASGTWTAPAGVTSVSVEAWGGGGAGGGQNLNSDGGGGGGGGAYSLKNAIAVTPGATYAVTVGPGGAGAPGAAGSAGGDSYFVNTTTVLAKGGGGGLPSTGTPPAGGAGGAAGSGVGDVKFSGGAGGQGRDSGTGRGGPGGSSAGTGAAGTSGPSPWSTLTAVAGPVGSGIGGNGGDSGNNGTAPASGNGGGGGGSGEGSPSTGGSGAAGKVIITYADPPTVSTGAATALTPLGATLNGTVSSNGAATTVTFEYGLTAAYGSVATADQSPLAAGASSLPVTATITGLSCNTLYHFRVRGANGVGSANGNDLTFTPPCPVVQSINRASPNPSTANSSVSWTVTFSDVVTGVDNPDFLLVETGGATGSSITSVTGPGNIWTVVANTGTAASGALGLNLVDNQSIVSGTAPLGGTGPVNGDFTGQTYTLVPPAPTLGKTASSASAVLGDVISFSITATNPYGVPLSNVVVTDVLPAGMSYSAFSVTLGTASVVGQTVTWTIPSLPAGGSAQMTLAVALTQQGVLTNNVNSPGATAASANVLVLASAVTHFRFDEPVGSWTGAAGEVLDSGGTALHGRRRTTSTPTTTNTVSPAPAIGPPSQPSVVGQFCNAGRFDGNAAVEVGASTLFDYSNQLSASVWVYPTSYPNGTTSDLYSILSNDANYEFHLNPAGRLYWWWGAANFTSAAVVPLNQWTHIAITSDSRVGQGRQRIYINGVLDANVNTWVGTRAANGCNFYLGGDVATGSCALLPARNFRGYIDEAKLYSYELSAAEVNADMNLGRSCSGTFDHIRIEHDASGSVCNPETVTVKACLNSNCTALYGGNVTVRLSPAGWVGGDTFTMSGGLATRQISNGTSGDVTLGTVSVAPNPGGATRCFNGAAETCTMNFAAASCAFDAAETGGNPQTRLLTKLSGTAFNIDLLALSSSTTINPSYSGSVTVDLVDASSTTCPATYPGLNTAATVTFANEGRKALSFNYPGAAPNVRVRAKVGAGLPACSYDNFAIRPAALLLASSDATNTSATGAPKKYAGENFNLTASAVNLAGAGVAGYTGTPAVDLTKVIGSPVAGTLAGAFGAANAATGQASGTFTYGEAGNFGLSANAVDDSTFTSVDQPNDCTSDYSNAKVGGKYGCKFGSLAVPQTTGSSGFGRFYPDHFETAVVPLSGVPMACPAGLTCPALYNGSVYAGQPLTLTVTAKNLSGVTTQNYSGATRARNVGLSAYAGKGDTAAPANAGTLSGSTLAAASFSNGEATKSTLAYAFSSPPAAPTDIYFRATEDGSGDGVTSLRTLNPTTTSVEGGVKVVQGRLRLSNAFNNGKAPLQIPVRAQFWTGQSWLLNSVDTSSLSPSAVALSPTATISGLSWANGQGFITLAAPSTPGSVDLALNLGATGAGLAACTVSSGGTEANLPWLRSRNGSCSSGYDRDPAAKATFGVFSPESRKTIHSRELF